MQRHSDTFKTKERLKGSSMTELSLKQMNKTQKMDQENKDSFASGSAQL